MRVTALQPQTERNRQDSFVQRAKKTSPPGQEKAGSRADPPSSRRLRDHRHRSERKTLVHLPKRSYFDGRLFGVCRVMSPLEKQNVEGYLANKWRMSYQLPATHPYRNRNSAPLIGA